MKAILVVMVTLLMSSNAWWNLNHLFTQPVATSTIPTTAIQIGCMYADKLYPPDSDVLTGYDDSTNACYGIHCDSSGELTNWYTTDCHTTNPPPPTTTSPPPPPTTTPPPPPPPTTTPPGCYYLDEWYAPGTKISNGEDLSLNWCWVVWCSDEGFVLIGDGYCYTPTKPTTTPPSMRLP